MEPELLGYVYTYGWNRCDPVGGGCATLNQFGPSHQLTPDDAGCTLTVIVGAHAGGAVRYAASLPSTPVQPAQTCNPLAGAGTPGGPSGGGGSGGGGGGGGSAGTPLRFTTTTLPSTQALSSLDLPLLAGGTPPYTITVTAGTFPRGLTATSDGRLTGGAQAAGTYTFTLAVKDETGATASQSFTLTVTASNVNDGGTTPASPTLGHIVLLAKRSRASRCARGANPDRRCSPGAYYSGLTKAVLCAPTFHTGTVPSVPDSEKHHVEVEYGLAPKAYGRTLEIDRIVPLELGGSNDIANLFPEPSSGQASYHAKDRLEKKLHSLVCSGGMSLHTAQAGIARDWQALYKTVFGSAV